jgi:hypothetical protein
MPDFNVRSDSVNVEQIMEQIRARIREKRGADYTEQEIRELAAVKLEKFLDPRGVRSDLLDEFRRKESSDDSAQPLPNYAFNDQTLYETHRGAIRFIRRLLNPILKLFFNPNPLIQALHIQSQLNTQTVQRDAARRGLVQLQYEVLHNLVVETTRLGIEVKNLKMRVESLTGRLEFNERRARALESVVVYKGPEERTPPQPARTPEPSGQRPEPAPAADGGASAEAAEGPGQRSRRRRRRRGRRGGAAAVSIMGGQQVPATSGGDAEAAREATEAHSPIAERIEQAMPADGGTAAPDEGHEPPSSPGPDDE